MNIAVLELNQQGVLTAIKQKWWKKSNCQVTKQS